MRYSRQLVMILMISVAAMISIGGNVSAAEAVEDYKEIFIKAALNDPGDSIQHLTVDTTGSLTVANKTYNFSGQGIFDFQQKPFVVGTGMVNTSVNTDSLQLEFKLPFCLEGSTIENISCLTAYWSFEGKWYKKKFPMLKAISSDSREQFRRMVKSVSLINENRDTYVFEVVINLKSNPELPKMPMADTQINPTGFMTGDFKYKTTVDKRRNVVTKISVDLADMLAMIETAVAQSPQMSETDKAGANKVFSGMKFKIDIGISKSNIEPPLRIPLEAVTATELLDTIGYVDKKRILKESPVIKSVITQCYAKIKELSQQLAQEKDSLSEEEYAQRKNEINQQIEELKTALNRLIQKKITQAMQKVKRENALTEITVTGKASNPFATVLDVTDAVIMKIETATE
jgi:hypothetical protein